MKKYLLFLFVFSLTHLFGAQKQKICLSMIVKDEAPVIERCLKSVKPFIDYWVIVDTGSTDGTQQIIGQYLDDIPGELYDRPWENFAHNRNEALALAKGKADYHLFIDADEVLRYSDNFQLPHLDKDKYLITMILGNTTYARAFLVRDSLPWSWKGVLHEYITCPELTFEYLLQDIKNEAHPDGHRAQDPNKLINDIKTLSEALKKEPDNARYYFYLAQSYFGAKEYHKALEAYEKRATMEGSPSETFWSLFRIGVLQQLLFMDSEIFTQSYIKAYLFDPTRAEPLSRLAHYYWTQEKYFQGFLIAQYAHSLPPPKEGAIFDDARTRDENIPLDLSLCAYFIGKYDVAKVISEEMLENNHVSPEIKNCVKKNLEEWIDPKIKYYKKGTPEEIQAFIKELSDRGEITR